MSNNKSTGFTLVELVILLVLVGIISATVISRIVSPSAFDALAARDNIIRTARVAQQLALGRDMVTLSISANGDDWTVSANENGTPIHSAIIRGDAIAFNTKSSTTSGLSCGNSTNDLALTGFSISYDGLGNAATFSNGFAPASVANGVRMCIDANIDNSICIAPSGFAYAGDCDD